MIVSDRLRAELIALADEKAPQEACALISAPSGAPKGRRDREDLYRLWRAENAAAEPETSFLIHPDVQVVLLQRIWARSEDVVGIFHSHPRSGPEPSERDKEMAAAIERKRAPEPPLVWVIVGVVPCPNCDEGTITNTEAACCGNLEAGDCCGCPIPVPVPEPCPTCQARGRVPALWVGVP